MRFIGFYLFCLLSFAAFTSEAAEFVTTQSTHSVSDTMSRLVKAIEAKGLKVFSRIDHAKGAKSIGESLKPAQVVLFGHPKLGTILMKAEPKIGLDLPLKVLIYEDQAGKTWLVHASADTLKARYGVKGADKPFKNMAAALAGLVKQAVQ